MPVEIRELVIRAVVNDSREQPAPDTEVESRAASDYEAIVEECVRQVLKILKKSGER